MPEPAVPEGPCTVPDEPIDARAAKGSWPAVPNPPSFPALERAVLEWWREHDVFAKSLRNRDGAPDWTFYEGPPTANGRPGTHHVEARTFKDVFPRYRTMKGYRVRRKGGWDCHGLPVELEVEKELGLSSKIDIERFGIGAFNERCRASVVRYVDAWRDLTERIGFWVNMDDAYWTMDPRYVDSAWWALKTLSERDLLFEDFRVSPYCARCGTALSDAEVALGYQSVEDPSVFVRFPLLDGPLAERDASLLVWTTTPWTLPANVAVAVGPDVAYQLVDDHGDLLVVAADRREAALGAGAVVVEALTASDLVGRHYRAPFDLSIPEGGSRYVVPGNFVTTGEGSGLVHVAPAFGADDMEVARREGLPIVNPVGPDGRFESGPWSGQFVKDADVPIVDALEEAGLLVRAEPYEHSYPFCWRCKTPLIYYAKPSWYVRTTAVRDRLLANNATIDWHPEHIRNGRFGKWLENNVDWALSRDRYWGTPLPFWRCGSCDHVTVVGSRAELGSLAGKDLSDLDPHRPYVDEVTLPCSRCGGEASRVPEVADAWFDSGAMPFAQWGYPYHGTEEFSRHFPADYVCEAIDQTRGWFYTLLAESTLLFDASSYRTVLCLGHIVDESGKKMSKSIGNVLDPEELIERHGADALRWLMLAEGSPWGPRRVGHNVVEDVVRRFLLTLWNTHHFFCTYAGVDAFDVEVPAPAVPDRPAADRWVLAELVDAVDVVDAALDRYDVPGGCRRVERFVADLSNWYVRRNRRRFWKAASNDPADKASAYHTLHTCLVTVARLIAPFTPFVADRLWGDLVRSQDPGAAASVHLADYPTAVGAWRDEPLRSAMATVRRVVEIGRQARSEAGIKIRQPLARAIVSVPETERAGVGALLDEIADELNVHDVALHQAAGAEFVVRTVRPNFRVLGPTFGKDAPQVADALRHADADTVERLVASFASGAGTLRVSGREVEVTPDMVEIVEAPRTGWQVASDGEVLIALDAELDGALRLEGAARELVRALNQQRKNLDLALVDRIEIAIDVGADLDRRLDRGGWYEVISRETLAEAVHRRPVGHDDAVSVDLGDLGRARVQVLR